MESRRQNIAYFLTPPASTSSSCTSRPASSSHGHRPRPRSQLFLQSHLVSGLQHIAYADKHLRLWVVDVPSGKPVLVDKGTYGGFDSNFSYTWSPDSKWIAYQRDLDNQLNAVFLYSIETHKFTQVTDGMSDAGNPVFDPNGKYLYFLASTDDGPSRAGIDLSSLDRAQTNAVYVAVLAKDGVSPVPRKATTKRSRTRTRTTRKDQPQKSADDQKKDDKSSAKDESKPGDKRQECFKRRQRQREGQARQSHRRSRRHRKPRAFAAHSTPQLWWHRGRQNRRPVPV